MANTPATQPPSIAATSTAGKNETNGTLCPSDAPSINRTTKATLTTAHAMKMERAASRIFLFGAQVIIYPNPRAMFDQLGRASKHFAPFAVIEPSVHKQTEASPRESVASFNAFAPLVAEKALVEETFMFVATRAPPEKKDRRTGARGFAWSQRKLDRNWEARPTDGVAQL